MSEAQNSTPAKAFHVSIVMLGRCLEGMKKVISTLWLGCWVGVFMAQADPIVFQPLSLEAAIQKAKSTGQFLFVDVYAEWCKPCKRLEKEVFADEEVGTIFREHYLAIRIDAEKEDPSLIESLDIEVYPTMLFYDARGRRVHRQEGFLNAPDFRDLALSIANLQQYHEAYDKRPGKSDVVVPYIMALKWVNPVKASKVAARYLMEVPEKKYSEPEHWELISNFITPAQRVMFNRIVNHEVLPQTYGPAFSQYLSDQLTTYLQKGAEVGNDAYLRAYTKYVGSLGDLLPNADSLLLVGKLQFYEKYQNQEFVDALIAYHRQYGSEAPDALAEVALTLTNNYFQRPVLEYAISLARRSINSAPGFKAYIAQALAYDRLGQFKSAYGNLLLAYEHAVPGDQEYIDELEQVLKVKLEQEFADGVNISQHHLLGEDGRFTLGSGDKRLMYGFPLPESTSHFIVNVDGALASNAPHLRMEHLRGKIQYGGEGFSRSVSIVFRFKEVEITQELIPVDREGAEIKEGFAQYYKVRYNFRNLSKGRKRIGLGVLFDTMIDDNDFCAIAADGKILDSEFAFLRRQMPEELLFYRTKGDTTDLMGAALLQRWDATKPDKMVVGRWPVLHQARWQLKPMKVPYGDSAYFLKWENRQLDPGREREFVTYYGLPDFKTPNLQLIMRGDPHATKELSLYFEHGSSQLDLNGKMLLSELITDEAVEITGVLLKGYTDVIGGSDDNFELSKKRIAAVGAILSAHKIAFVPKPYGMDESEDTLYNRLYGNAYERKVDVVIYYQRAATSLLSRE